MPPHPQILHSPWPSYWLFDLIKKKICVQLWGISISPSLLSAFSSSKHRLHEKINNLKKVLIKLSTQIQTQLEIKLYWGEWQLLSPGLFGALQQNYFTVLLILIIKVPPCCDVFYGNFTRFSSSKGHSNEPMLDRSMYLTTCPMFFSCTVGLGVL